MKDLITPVNVDALSRAQIAVVGEENTKLIIELYGMIDKAMVFGYEKGLAEGAEIRAEMADEYVAALQRQDDSRQEYADDAFERGRAQAEGELYDDGYVDGVADARAFPGFADEQVARLCAEDDYYEDPDMREYDGQGHFMERSGTEGTY